MATPQGFSYFSAVQIRIVTGSGLRKLKVTHSKGMATRTYLYEHGPEHYLPLFGKRTCTLDFPVNIIWHFLALFNDR